MMEVQITKELFDTANGIESKIKELSNHYTFNHSLVDNGDFNEEWIEYHRLVSILNESVHSFITLMKVKLIDLPEKKIGILLSQLIAQFESLLTFGHFIDDRRIKSIDNAIERILNELYLLVHMHLSEAFEKPNEIRRINESTYKESIQRDLPYSQSLFLIDVLIDTGILPKEWKSSEYDALKALLIGQKDKKNLYHSVRKKHKHNDYIEAINKISPGQKPSYQNDAVGPVKTLIEELISKHPQSDSIKRLQERIDQLWEKIEN